MPGIRLILFGLLTFSFSFASPVAQAQDELSYAEEVCEAPISTCQTGPVISDSTRPDIYPPPECPRGYECVCVPSCPTCKDCAAEVCVRGAPEPECKTACDCPVGQGCSDGQCVHTFKPVYCCERDRCPVGEQCQSGEDGEYHKCEPPHDPMCLLRQQKASMYVARTVLKYSRCEKSSDCAFIGTSTDCGGTCGAYVNRRGLDDAQDMIKRIDDKFCRDYQADGCPYATPSCLYTVPACIENKCVGLYPPPDPRPLPYTEVEPAPGQILELEPRR